DGVVVIDRFLADRYWPGEDPIGKRLIRGSIPNTTPPQPKKWEIIGVVAPVKNSNLETPVTKETVYFSTLQVTLQSPLRTMTLVVKTAGSPGQLVAPLRATVLALDSELPIYDIK